MNLPWAHSRGYCLVYHLSKHLPLIITARYTLSRVLTALGAIAKAFAMLNDVCIKLVVEWKVNISR